MELDKFTKGMNVGRAEKLGCYNIDGSGIEEESARETDSMARKAGGRPRGHSVLGAR